MIVRLNRVGDLVTLEADGSPEDLAAFCRLSGIDVEGRVVMIPGPKGDKGDAGPAGPCGPAGAPGLFGGAAPTGQCGCVCPPGAEIGCSSSGCPRKGFHFGQVTCATGLVHPSYAGTMLFNGADGNVITSQSLFE